MSIILVILSALTTGLCYSVYDIGFIAYFSVVPFLYVIMKEAASGKKLRRFYLLGYLWSTVYFICIFHWFAYQYPLEYNNFTKFEAVMYVFLTCVGIPLVLSLVLAVWPLLCGLFMRGSLHKKLPWLSAVFIAAVYTVFEWLFTLTTLAVPWAKLAITQQNYTLSLQSSSLFGSYFVSFLIILVNALLALGIYGLINGGRKIQLAVSAGVCAAVLASNIGLGAILFAADKSKEEKTSDYYSAVAAQGNYVSGRTDSDNIYQMLEVFLSLADEAITDDTVLVVLPEGSFPVDMKNYPLLCDDISRFAKERGVSVILGSFMWEMEDEADKLYNVTWCYTPDGQVSEPYRKQHIVPFGEYTPARELLLKLLPFMEDVTGTGSDLSRGDETVVFETPQGKVASLICFDSAFDALGVEAVRAGAEILTVSTNDSWWMDSAELYMHNAHSILRSIETRRYIVRSASAGYSTVINARGEILSDVPALTRGVASADVAYREDTSLYVRCPYLLLSLCGAFTLACAAVSVAFSVKEKRNGKAI